jgi:RNA polymerase sigma factor (sigma-70 family)
MSGSTFGETARTAAEGPGLPLLGRDEELASLTALLDHVSAGGASLVVEGDPGIGKSALLDAFSDVAEVRGVQTLRTVGVPAERGMAFAGLHRLLRTYLARAGDLPEPQRDALAAAFGHSWAAATDLLLVALAALELLADEAAESPLLIIAEDVQWLDPDTVHVLGFIARRIELEPILLIAAARDRPALPSPIADLPRLSLGPLGQTESEQLVDRLAPSLPAALRARVIEASGGNPLALVEFARATSRGADLSPFAPLPMTERLMRAFSELLPALSPETRYLLLVMALDEGGSARVQFAAASSLAGRELSDDDALPAFDAGLLVLEGGPRFRHPSIRAAVESGATPSARRAAHNALALAYDQDPDRRLGHRGAAAIAPDDHLASELERAGLHAMDRGAPAVAAAAFERATELTTQQNVRGRLLVQAAEMELDIGRHELAYRLLIEAKALPLAPETQAHLSFIAEASSADIWSGPERVAAVADAARQLGVVAPALAPRAFLTAAIACWWGNPAQETRDLVITASRTLSFEADDPFLLGICAFADPCTEAAGVTAAISRIRLRDVTDPEALLHIGSAATAVWQFDQALPFLTAAVESLRARGRARLLAQALVYLSWAALHLTRETLAVEAADEAARLADDTGQRLWATAAELARATVAGERGDFDTANALAERAEAELLPRGAHSMLALVQFARGRGAVAHQSYSEGYEQLRRILDPADVAYHPFVGAWALSDLIESAASIDREQEARQYLGTLESLVAQTQASFLRATLSYAKPLLAPDGEAEELFQAAIGNGLSNWPCYRGRLLLNFGRWLRRQRRISESRAPLRAARENFDALAFQGLAEKARAELRASGETSRQRVPDARDVLSPQELQIAEMAAAGLSNREIGQQLFLSHRTVESHLYRIFRKLGLTSRVQLSAVSHRSPHTQATR